MTETALPVLNPESGFACQLGARPELTPRTLGSIVDAVRGNLAARRMLPPSFMELILTSDCNLRCTYCFEKDKKPIDMPEETAYAAIDFLMEASGPIKKLTILLFGGEPMLRFDLMKKLHAYATNKANVANKSISWDMTTNGTLVDEPAAKWLAKHGVKYLLSMDGAQEDHDRYRRFPNGQGTFALLAHRLPMLKHYQPWMGVKMSITPKAAPNLRRNIEQLYRIGVNQFIFGYAHGLRWTDAELAAYEAATLELVELYLEMVHSKRHFRITTFEEDNVRNADEPTPFGCGAGRGRFAVDPLGDLYGCSKMATIMGPGNGALPLGNVFQGYTRIDNRRCCLDATVEHRQTCRCCELREFCGGGCPATNFADTGNTYLPGDTACKLVFISRRVNEYVRRRRQDVFGANPTKDRACRPSAGPSDTDRRDRRLGNE